MNKCYSMSAIQSFWWSGRNSGLILQMPYLIYHPRCEMFVVAQKRLQCSFLQLSNCVTHWNILNSLHTSLFLYRRFSWSCGLDTGFHGVTPWFICILGEKKISTKTEISYSSHRYNYFMDGAICPGTI